MAAKLLIAPEADRIFSRDEIDRIAARILDPDCPIVFLPPGTVVYQVSRNDDVRFDFARLQTKTESTPA